MPQFIIDCHNKWEVPEFGFTTGVTGVRRIGNRFGLSSGILYAVKEYKLKVNLQGMFGIYELESRYNFHCIDVPVGINYVAGRKHLYFVSNVSLTGNLFLQEKVRHHDQSNKTYDDYRRVWLTGEAGAGVGYELSRKIVICG